LSSAVPVTFFHLFNTPRRYLYRWQSAPLCASSYIGLFFALFLPAFIWRFHHHQELAAAGVC
jgi:hypothetical protein